MVTHFNNQSVSFINNILFDAIGTNGFQCYDLYGKIRIFLLKYGTIRHF